MSIELHYVECADMVWMGLYNEDCVCLSLSFGDA